MTCHQALTLLDDFIDGDLTKEMVGEVEQHVEICPACRKEYDAAMHLKELLSSHVVPDPGGEYWAETSRLIIARTVDSEESQTHTVITDISGNSRTAFFRSLVSLAASILILLSALWVGQSQEQPTIKSNCCNPYLMSSSLADDISSDNNDFSEEELKRLVRGVNMIGSPTGLGRYMDVGDMTFASSQGR